MASAAALLRKSAKERGIAVDLTADELQRLHASSCVYCGAQPANGVDRLDSAGPYRADNAVACCGPCNRMKKDLPPWYFVAACSVVAGRGLHQPEHIMLRPRAADAHRRYAFTVYDARRRGLACTLTPDQHAAIVARACTFCRLPACGGVDRVLSSGGYTPANVQPCCLVCNLLKCSLTDAAFRAAAAAVADRHQQAALGGTALNWLGYGLVTVFGALHEIPAASQVLSGPDAIAHARDRPSLLICAECHYSGAVRPFTRGLFACDTCWARVEQQLQAKRAAHARRGDGHTRRQALSAKRKRLASGPAQDDDDIIDLT